MNKIRKILSHAGLFLLGILGASHAAVAATPPSPSEPVSRSPQTEVVSEFDVEGVHFLVFWKPGLCLLRTVEDYGKPDSRMYTVADLNQRLNEGESDNSHVLDSILKVPHSKNLHHRNGMSKEEAIAKAPVIAKELIREQRRQEVQQMEQLYTSPDMQRNYPVYQVWQQEVKGKSYPVIWASHNAGLYMRVNGHWRVAGFAQSRKEAEAKIGKTASP